MVKKIIVFILGFNYCFGQLPNTDLWLFSIKKEKENYSVEKGVNITNRDGYDNQPSFNDEGKQIFYVSIREDKQADIYIYSIKEKKSIRLTQTNESEYSPGTNFKEFTCLTVEKDSAQRIWIYDAKNGVQKKSLFDEDSIGYYNFLNKDTVVYYKLTAPHSLRLRSIASGKDIRIADNPVRGFRTISRHEFIYGIKDSAKVTFYRYNTLLQKSEKYCDYNSLNEDVVWHPLWGLLKSEQSSILRYDEKQKKWFTLFDFASSGIKKITRFVFDSRNSRIVVVSNL